MSADPRDMSMAELEAREAAVDAEVARRDGRSTSVAALGERVSHERFGRGTVKASDGNKLVIDFPSHGGPRTVISSFVKPCAAEARLCAPFRWRPPESLPKRAWLYGNDYLRRFVSVTLGHGGGGKSAKLIVEACAMASGKSLLGVQPVQRLRVAYWNGEDPLEETERRVLATALHYGLGPDDLEGWLFTGSGRREGALNLARMGRRGGAEIDPEELADVCELMERTRADVLIIDPFVATHSVGENDNGAVAMVMAAWGGIAEDYGAAVHLAHHARKGQAGGSGEVTVEDGRGASAMLAAARSARVLNPMTKAEASDAGVEKPRSFFRVDNGKANLAPPPDGSTWFRFVGVDLGNGDNVGVVEPWKWPNAMDGVKADDLLAVQRAVAAGEWRADAQASAWVGNAVAEVLKLDLVKPADKGRVKVMLRRWFASGALKETRRTNGKGKEQSFVEVGTWVDQ